MTESAETIVQRQLDAYNARDLDALVAVYADDAQLFEHPSTLLAAGSAALRERFAPRLREPNLHARLLQRIVMGAVVTDYAVIGYVADVFVLPGFRGRGVGKELVGPSSSIPMSGDCK